MFDAYPTTEHIPIVKKEKKEKKITIILTSHLKCICNLNLKHLLKKSVVSGVMSCSCLFMKVIDTWNVYPLGATQSNYQHMA